MCCRTCQQTLHISGADAATNLLQAGFEQAQMSAAHAHLQTRHFKQPQAATRVLQARDEDVRRLASWQQTCLTVADDLASNDPRIPRSLMRDVIFSDGRFVSKVCAMCC